MDRRVLTVAVLVAVLCVLAPVRALLAVGPVLTGQTAVAALIYGSAKFAAAAALIVGMVVAFNADRLLHR